MSFQIYERPESDPGPVVRAGELAEVWAELEAGNFPGMPKTELKDLFQTIILDTFLEVSQA
jgi:hypothetical protein